MNPKKARRPRAPRAIRPLVPIVPTVHPPSTFTTDVPSTPAPTTNLIEGTLIEETPEPTRAKWDHDDDQTMIDVLTAERQPANAAIGPENATCAQGWKKPTWMNVVKALAGSEKKIINGIVQVSHAKTVENCKSHWYVLCGLYDHYKYLNGLSGAGWENGCITLPDQVWAPIIANQKSKKCKALLLCRDRPFPIFNSLAPLLEGHKATGKYVASAIVDEPAKHHLATPSTSAIVPDHEEPGLPSPLPSPFASPRSSPPPSDRFIPPAESHAMDDSSSDETPSKKRHLTSKAALAARAPIKKKKQSGVEIMDNLSSTMQDFGTSIKSSITSTSANIDNAARLLAEPVSSHAQAVKLVYSSDMNRTQRYAAVDLFGEKPLMAETYLNTPAADRDDWLEYILNKRNEVSTV